MVYRVAVRWFWLLGYRTAKKFKLITTITNRKKDKHMKKLYAIVTRETEGEVPALFESSVEAFNFALDLNLGGAEVSLNKGNNYGEYYVIEVTVMPDPKAGCCSGKCKNCKCDNEQPND